MRIYKKTIELYNSYDLTIELDNTIHGTPDKILCVVIRYNDVKLYNLVFPTEWVTERRVNWLLNEHIDEALQNEIYVAMVRVKQIEDILNDYPCY